MTGSADEPTAPSIGVIRAPGASTDATIATIEARIVRTELERRIGPVTLDLRTDGEAIGPWLPRKHAAWPADVDATIDLGDLGELSPELVGLFARTLEPAAVEVRRRMLEHLDVLPIVEPALTSYLLDKLLPRPARPTDLWLVVCAAATVATDEPAHRRLLAEPGDPAAIRLDRWFDEAVAALHLAASPAAVARLRAENLQLNRRLAAMADDQVRAERTMLGRLDDLTSERDSLRERLVRAELDRIAVDGGPA